MLVDGYTCARKQYRLGSHDIHVFMKPVQFDTHFTSLYTGCYTLTTRNAVVCFLVIEKLKEIMTEVENSINTFKEDQRQRYETFNILTGVSCHVMHVSK